MLGPCGLRLGREGLFGRCGGFTGLGRALLGRAWLGRTGVGRAGLGCDGEGAGRERTFFRTAFSFPADGVDATLTGALRVLSCSRSRDRFFEDFLLEELFDELLFEDLELLFSFSFFDFDSVLPRTPPSFPA